MILILLILRYLLQLIDLHPCGGYKNDAGDRIDDISGHLMTGTLCNIDINTRHNTDNCYNVIVRC